MYEMFYLVPVADFHLNSNIEIHKCIFLKYFILFLSHLNSNIEIHKFPLYCFAHSIKAI